MQSFPSEKSAIRLIGAVLAETDEEWSQRRLLSPESVARVWQPACEQFPSEQEVDAATERARRIIGAALEGAAEKK